MDNYFFQFFLKYGIIKGFSPKVVNMAKLISGRFVHWAGSLYEAGKQEAKENTCIFGWKKKVCRQLGVVCVAVLSKEKILYASSSCGSFFEEWWQGKYFVVLKKTPRRLKKRRRRSLLEVLFLDQVPSKIEKKETRLYPLSVVGYGDEYSGLGPLHSSLRQTSVLCDQRCAGFSQTSSERSTFAISKSYYEPFLLRILMGTAVVDVSIPTRLGHW